jgi:hypothetical protein
MNEFKKGNYGSQKKLNFKISSQTPSGIIDHSNMVIKQIDAVITPEQKLEKFHEWCNKCLDSFTSDKNTERSNAKFNSSIDQSYIDAKKEDFDILAVPEYSDEIFQNEKKKPKFYMPKVDYMLSQTDINQKMRRILVDWIVKVHQKFKLLPETLYLTINIIDRYLSVEVVSRKVLQLIGVTAMHVACKYEEIYPPEANDFVYITDNAYTKKELLETEYKIFKVLEFELTFISPFRHLQRLCNTTQNIHLFTAAKELMDLILIDYNMIKYQPEIIAASSLYLAHVINRKKGSGHSQSVNAKHELLDNGSRLLVVLCKHVGGSENTIKKCAIDVNGCRNLKVTDK